INFSFADIKISTGAPCLISWVLISFLTVVGCNQVTSITNSQTVELTVSAAASMQDALSEVAKAYQEEFPDTKITYNFATSESAS
ncbi:MAG: hypothetical protein AAFR83_07815, partial [Cyanobacteria bacterium J06629_18]